MRILITGNMGYVGPVVVEHLATVHPEARLVGLDLGWFAHALLDGSAWPERRVADQRIGDVRRVAPGELEGFDAVVHLAAISNDPMSHRWSDLTREINHLGTRHIAEQARRAGVRRFVFASSCSVYGTGGDSPVSEGSPTNPLTPYAQSKLAAEEDLAKLAGPGFTVTALRFATAFGLSPRLRLDLVLNDFAASAVERGRVVLNSDGMAWRPLIHVRDMARAIEWALSRDDGGSFRLFNAGSSAGNWRIRDLATLVAEALGVGGVEFGPGAGADARSYRVDFSAFEREASSMAPREDARAAVVEMAGAIRAMLPLRRDRFARLALLAGHTESGRLDRDLGWRSGGCRACGAPPGPVVIDLGETALANSYLEPGDPAGEAAFPLRARLCPSCKLVQLDHVVPPERIFSNYSYLSSYSSSWLDHARRFCADATARLGLERASRVVEIASNDGYLLRNFVASGIPCLGVEPAANVAERARSEGVPTLVRFFSRETADELVAGGGQADLVVANNVLAHVPAPNGFVAGLRRVVKPDGAVSIEFPHLLELVRGRQFDTIYHEHYSYFSLLAAEALLERNRLRVFEVERLNTHGGSLRLWACRTESARFAESPSVAALRAEELAAGLDRPEGFAPLAREAESMRSGLVALLDRLCAEGKTVAAYGAAAKGNTLLNYCGIGPERIRFVADRSPLKQGRLLPGSHIPVVDPDTVFRERPDYLLILAWNLEREIRDQMRGIDGWGGRFLSVHQGVES